MKSLQENFKILIEERAGMTKLSLISGSTLIEHNLSILTAQLRGVPNSWEIDFSTFV